ncbi:MAG: hypothetical protein C3F17_06430 [Bradyrhizobiaceae bacterium]|nr:MAG: hypothetical protein C3F17_06430 [Bradyrhizobiaceae bacterium]
MTLGEGRPPRAEVLSRSGADTQAARADPEAGPQAANGQRPLLVWDWGRRGAGPFITLQLVRRLIAQGYGDRIVLSLSEQNELIDEFRRLGLPMSSVHTFDGRPSLAHLARISLSLVRPFREQLARYRPTTVLVPMLFGAAMPLAPFARRAADRLIFVVHDVHPHQGERTWLAQLVAQRYLLRLADTLVTISGATRVELVKWRPSVASRVVVEPLAGLYDKLSGPRTFPQGRRLRFLVPGRQVRYKGYGRLAQALRLLEGADFELTVVGDGPERALVEKTFGGLPNVTLRSGWASVGEHRRLFDDHDVLVCPYDEGSQSGLIGDALARSMPTIVTPVGALPEQIGFGRAGWIAADMTPPALAKLMTAVARGEVDYATCSSGCGTILDEARAASNWPRTLGLAPV